MLAKIEIAFGILKNIKREIAGWEREGLNDIEDKDVYDVINLLRLFMEVKKGG